MKRFAWLWGALLGATLFPWLMLVCDYIASSFLPCPAGTVCFVLDPSKFLLHLLEMTRDYGIWSGGVGGCGAMLWTGQGSLKWRLLSPLVGTATVTYLLWDLWTYWHTMISGNANSDNRDHSIAMAIDAPLLLGALLLVFFALLMRSSPTSVTNP